MYARRSARVLLVDGRDRLLLLGNHFDHGDVWLTPGGGRRRFEPAARAAARELHEEVGLRVPRLALGRPVAYTTGYADLGFAKGRFRDDFFFHRIDSHEIDTSRMEALERGFHTGHRWWSIPELESTAETIYPFALPELMTKLLAGRLSAEQVRLPWHH